MLFIREDGSAGANAVCPGLSKKVCSSLGPLCEGAPPAGGGGENCAIARNISGNGKALSLRPYGATAPLLALRAISPVPGESVSQREVFRHAAGKHSTSSRLKKRANYPRIPLFLIACTASPIFSTGIVRAKRT